MRACVIAVRGAVVALAVALGLLACLQWRATHGVHVGATLRLAGTHWAEAALILESTDRLWPPRADAAFERARLALQQGDFETAWHWLERCRGRVPSRLRWKQLAANVEFGRGNLDKAERHLSEALALRPRVSARDWRALADLRERLGASPASVQAARLRADLHGREIGATE
jgi:tetratricopeptide (TPR) repeat protein